MPGLDDSASLRAVIVGGSLAALRSAEALRKGGFPGEIVVIGDEPHMPYNRPPLSKDALFPPRDDAGSAPDLSFRIPRHAQDVQWRLGERVTAADLAARTVTLAGGETLRWDGLVVATGLRPRRLAVPGPQAGRHVIRTLDDAAAFRKELTPGARLVVIGAGFIGCETAAVARAAGLDVDVVAPEQVPIERPLQALLGQAVQQRHEAQGVRFHLGAVPVRFGGADRVTSVTLSTGEELPADLVIEAVGCSPNTEWLDGNGLDLTDGVLCDNLLRVEGRPDIVACGDIARFPNPLFGDVPRRVEHWTMVTDTGKKAGHTLAQHLTAATAQAPAPAVPFAPIPSFWSDQYDLRIQSFGAVSLGSDDVRVLEGDLAADVAVGYHRADRLVGVVLIGLAHRYAHYRALIAAPAS
jgi:3-phenylpropionate/trans-cinnamate dioxygenase ferredoxin reductase subunit